MWSPMRCGSPSGNTCWRKRRMRRGRVKEDEEKDEKSSWELLGPFVGPLGSFLGASWGLLGPLGGLL
eukprot:725853-Pyramimonas_sp.AAC.1